jgi:histidinol-phosphatase
MQPGLTTVLETARRAVEEASKASLVHFRRDVEVEWKADRSPVTAADKASEAAILAAIRERFPDHEILTEESGSLGSHDAYRWIIDPLDGTRGFSRGGRFWGPMVAFEQHGEVVAGAIGLPASVETYWAARGLGAFLNGERLRVSEVSDWSEATLSVGELRRLLAPPWRDGVTALATSAASTRCYGDLAGCAMVLTGRAEAWIEAGVRTWDLAPLKILVEEAGGRYTDLDGGSSVESGHALVTNGKLHDHALRALAGSLVPELETEGMARA